jgi:tetratricopeptide (TPR) repeat protein/transcriptional regulator with XRE-family HTH domain
MDEIISFGAWVQQRRKALDLTQAELAGRIGCAAVTIKKIEQDERRPSRQMADLLADHLLIPSLERDAFLRRARGQFVPASASPAEAIHLPAFLKSGDLSGPQPSLPFVGRERELAQLQAHLNAVLAGEGRVVFITGEAGEGKTTLMAEFARRAQAAHPDLIVAGGLCNAFAGGGDPYLPFRDIFSLLTGDLEPRRAAGLFSAEQARRLWQFLPRTIQALAEHGPDLMNVLVSTAALAERIAAHGWAGAGWLNSLQVLIEAPGLANLEQRQLFEQVTLVLRALAAAQPLLLLLDDLQWADSASLNLLFHLGRRLPGSRILILAAYRASEASVGGAAGSPAALLERVVNELKRHFGDIQLDLEQFNPAEERAFVDALLDREPNHLGPAFRETLFWCTKGHPLFTVELLRDLQERGNLARDEAGCWVEGAALDWKTLPIRVEAVIKQRIDRLDAGLQELLAIASVEGERFTAQVVARAQQQDERQVLRQLAQELGHRHRLVREYEEVKVDSHYLTRFQFGHALFQQYLYHRLSQGERRLWHGQIARILETIYAGDLHDIIVPLAYHYTQAGDAAKAVHYLLRAGDQAHRVVALDEAIHFYRAALEQWPAGDQAGRAETLRKLGESLLVTGQFQDAMAAYEAGQALFEQLGDRVQAGAMHRLMGRLYWEQDDRARAERHYHQALAILEQGPETVELARAISGISQMHMLASHYDQAIAWGRRALALAERLSAEDVMIHALNNIGASYMRSRDWEQGLAMLQDSLQRALKMGLPHDACRAYVNLGEGLGWKSRYAEVRTTFEEMLAYATRVHANVFAGVALVRLGELEWQVGQWDAALAWRQRIVEWMDSLPVSTVPRVWASTFLGWLHNDLGQPQAARQILEADLPGARGLAEIQSTVPHLAQLARALAGLGLETETTALVQEFLALVDRTPDAHPTNTGPLLFACRWFAAHPASADLSPARACLSRLERACAQLGSPDTEATYREGQAVIALAGSSPAQAVEPFQDAAGRWQALNRPYDRLRTLSGLGRAFQQLGDLRAAQTTFDQARAGIETLAAQLQDPGLKTSFLSSPLVQEIQTRALENSKRLRLKPSG